MMTSPGKRAFVLSALAALGLLGPRMAAAAPMTYIALGDSLTFGVGENDTATDISNGDRGFVKPFADTLASLNGGVRPNVINLGVGGTTTVSFFEGGGGIMSPLDGPPEHELLGHDDHPEQPAPGDARRGAGGGPRGRLRHDHAGLERPVRLGGRPRLRPGDRRGTRR